MFPCGLRALESRTHTIFLRHRQHCSTLCARLTPESCSGRSFSISAARSCTRPHDIQDHAARRHVVNKSSTGYRNSDQHTQQGIYTIVAVCGGVIFLQLAYSHFFTPSSPSTPASLNSEVDSEPDLKPDLEAEPRLQILPATPAYADMPVPSGHLGNLTPEQEAKLRAFWAVTLKTFGVETPAALDNVVEEHSELAPSINEPAATTEEKKKKRKGLFGKKRDKDKHLQGSDSVDSAASGATGTSAADEDKYGQMKEFQEILEKQSPESLRTAFWTMVKADHPDALLLRFLRARKWDVDKALVMLVATMSWRSVGMAVDSDIMKRGEGGAVEDAQTSDKAVKKEGEDFLTQLKLGKSFLHGTDKEGRPLCVVRTRLHKPGEQSEKSMERYTVYVIETARLVLRPPVETACIIFDMSHFSLSNMDYAPVKFMIKCFEANYPESLGAVLVHKAPFIFSTIFNIIKGWLDPVVAAKIHFTKSVEDLETYIPRSQIIKELGGDEAWEYKYIEPVPGENEAMKDDAPRTQLEQQRTQDVLTYQTKTFEWIAQGNNNNEESVAIKKERDALAARLHDNYWQLDPYLRARSLYDRTHMIEQGGNINFYPTKKPVVNGAATSTATAAPSSAAPDPSDVD